MIIPIFVISSFLYFIPDLFLIEIRESNVKNKSIEYHPALIEDFYAIPIIFTIHLLPYISNVIIIIFFNFVLILKLRKQISEKYYLIQFALVGIDVNMPASVSTTTGSTSFIRTIKSPKLYCKHYFSKENFKVDDNIKSRQLNECRNSFVKAKILETKMTKLVLVLSTSFICQQLIYGLATNLYGTSTEHTTEFKIKMMSLHVTLVLIFSSNIFVYYKFDRAFSARLKLCFRNLFTCCFKNV